MVPDHDAPEQLLNVSVSPHIRDRVTVPRIMWSVVLALLPALFGSVYFFGTRALWLVLLGVSAAVLTEAACQKLRKKPVTITDGSAVVTGILLVFCLPPGVPWWIPVVGSAFAIAIGKQVFGGLGYNPFNPALLGQGTWQEIALVATTCIVAGLLVCQMSMLMGRGLLGTLGGYAILACAMVVGSATLWIGKSDPLALAPAAVGLLIVYLFRLWRVRTMASSQAA